MPSSKKSALPPYPPHKIGSREDLRKLQRCVAQILFRPLTGRGQMQPLTQNGRSMSEVASRFIKPNGRLTSFERLEIYSRQYWFRVLDALSEDFPGLHQILGVRSFRALAQAYLTRYPSDSYTLRNLGRRLEGFMRQSTDWDQSHRELALEMVRFEWAQIVAFDGASIPAIQPAELLAIQPHRLRLALQPYLTLLQLGYPLDEFLVAIKDQKALRREASNAYQSATKQEKLRTIRRPRRLRSPIHLVVHRFYNVVHVKRISSEAYALLQALQSGATLTQSIRQVLPLLQTSEGQASQAIESWFTDWSALGWFGRRSDVRSERHSA